MTLSGNHVRRTRLAPSPTGALHLGNARTFLINWALARQNNWHIVMRIEDLDGPRIKPQAATEAIDILQWLGLDWDEGPYFQTNDLSPYETALRKLTEQGMTYPCTCSRKEIEQAQSAPHGDEHELRYPGTCRESAKDKNETSATRVRVPNEEIVFTDTFHGPQTYNVQQQVGDIVVATKAGLPAYQLAVVVDDARQNITDIVRGDDLLASTARQILLYRLLDLGTPPSYTHLPLVLGHDGRRLAKRHGDTRISAYREAGVHAQRIIGLLGYWCGIINQREPMSADNFMRDFKLDDLPRNPITMTKEDDAWLRN